MEPLRLIYDGYEIEIRSCGESMPIVTMHKIQTNTIENDIPKLPKTIRGIDYQKTTPDWWENYPSWWQQPPMWWYNPSVTCASWTNEDSLDYGRKTTNRNNV